MSHSEEKQGFCRITHPRFSLLPSDFQLGADIFLTPPPCEYRDVISVFETTESPCSALQNLSVRVLAPALCSLGFSTSLKGKARNGFEAPQISSKYFATFSVSCADWKPELWASSLCPEPTVSPRVKEVTEVSGVFSFQSFSPCSSSCIRGFLLFSNSCFLYFVVFLSSFFCREYCPTLS